MPAKIAKTHNLSPALNIFKRTGEAAWYPLVFVWLASTDDGCDNPNCSAEAKMKQVHLLSGEIFSIYVCFPCAQQLALDTGMIGRAEDFAVLEAAAP